MDTSGIKVSVLEPGAFKGKNIIVKLPKHISQSECRRLQDTLKKAFPGANKILVLGADVDMELPRDGTIVDAVPLEHFVNDRDFGR